MALLFSDTYKTIAASAEGAFSDRGSKFIGLAFPISGEEPAKAIIAEIRAKHPKARHCCWAYRLTPDRSVFRLSDDGEPAGSAGRPILNVLFSHDVTNTLVVVVRYFGGTLLGIPGLIKAYKTAAIEALQSADIVERTVNDIYRIEFDYPEMNEVMRIIKEEELQIVKQQLNMSCSIEIGIRRSEVNRVVDKFNRLKGASLMFLYTR